ncbi:TonB-dependent siderophore receptor [Methylocystis parvus]|uniref:TonB-dependent siderophore receptor n=1 Tax=Methylocystis parvus TaxID=134 RepID=UPI0003178BC0|nr:TonB-dependent receptor plug domain-containing protein [Methylocystis parvus]
MSINALLRGVSVGAVVVVFSSSMAGAQQNLPTIDVGSAQRTMGKPHGAQTSTGGSQRGASQPSQPQSVAATPLLGIPRRQDSYVVKETSTATKMNIPNLQLPASVKVVPAEVLRDQQITDLKGALENVSGVQTAQSQGGNASFNRIRGFLTPRVFRNGLMATSPTNFTDFGTSNVERIEVMKGPDAMLYGRSDPGGMINLVTKRPVVDRIHMIQQRFGQFDNYFTEWDLADSATADRSVLYRFSGGYMNSGGFRDFDRIERVHVNPSVAWRPTDDTTFVADVEYYDQDFRPNLGLTVNPFNTTRPADVPISRNFAGPHTPLSNNRNIYAGSELTHRFNDTFTFKQRFLASFLHHNDAYSSNAGIDATGNVLRIPFSQQNDSQVYGTNFDLLGHFDLGDTHHDTLVGFDYQHVYSLYGNQGRFFSD